MSLDLGVHKSPQNVGSDWKVDEDELGLLMKAEEGEVVAQLHGLDGVLLLWTRIRKRVKCGELVSFQSSAPSLKAGAATQTTNSMRKKSHMTNPAEMQRGTL